MEEKKNYLQKVSCIEMQFDALANELLTLNEELFNTGSYPVQELPLDYCEVDTAIQEAETAITKASTAMKLQAILKGSGFLEKEDVRTAKEKALQAVLK